ncbi:kinase-like domain-containing protein, partial [Vararia minispora EC-137]
RNLRSQYVIPSTLISIQHCKIYAIASGAGGIIVSCSDMSTNGLWLNDHLVHRCSVILLDGDIIRFPNGKAFRCFHLTKTFREKSTIFDPTPPSEPSCMAFGAYTILSHCLGTGGFATVHLAIDTANHRQVACKVIKSKNGRRDFGTLLKEVRILAKVRHPNINSVVDIVHPSVESPFLKIFLQLCTGGDLFSFIVSHADKGQRMHPREAQFIMYQILQALKYLHDREICHRGTFCGPENVLLFAPGHYPRIQLADFGLARAHAYQSTLNACGTVSYLPPEGILALDQPSFKYVGKPSDCWSACVIFPYPFLWHRWASKTNEDSRVGA